MDRHQALCELFATRWAASPEALHGFLGGLLLGPGELQAIAGTAGTPRDTSVPVTTRDGIATIWVRGLLFRYPNWLTRNGYATALEDLAPAVLEAQTAPEVRGTILHIDSPGGDVNGLQETGELLWQARDLKPLVSYVSGDGASGGYWLASVGRRVWAGPTAVLGGIGVMATFIDWTDWNEKMGIKEIRIVSTRSPRKDLDPDTDEGRAAVLAVLDPLADVFIDTVARNRGVSRETVLTRFGQGGVMVGAEAVAAGLADEIQTYEALHAAFAAALGGSRPFTALFPGRMALSPTTQDTTQEGIMPPQATPQDLTAQAVAAAHPDWVASWRAEGASAERERLAGIEALAVPGMEQVIAAAKADPACSPEMAAYRILAAEAASRKKGLEARAAEEQGSDQPTAASAPTADPGTTQAIATRLKRVVAQIHAERERRAS